MMKYDYCIVGAGPTGLTLSYLFSAIGKKCLLIDPNTDIGGCHRVKRQNGLFTEHGPRIYSNSYLNTIRLLKTMKLDFNKMFIPYEFTISKIGNYTVKNFNFNEIRSIILHYIIMIVKPNHGKDVSMKKFMETNLFSDKTKDYIDRLCRLTDGATSDNYSVNKFFQLINQQFLHTIYQPSSPNDIGLFQKWRDILDKQGVDIMLNSEVIRLNGESEKQVKSADVLIQYKQIKRILTVNADNFVLCIPPKPLYSLISNSPTYKDSFGNINNLYDWVIKSSYSNYIPLTFHWDSSVIKNESDIKKLNLNNIWGFPKSEWGIAFIILSKYMKENELNSSLLISTCITKPESLSSSLNKTAYQCNEDEIKQEVFRQLKISFPNLPNPTHIVINPNVKKSGDKWIESDTAYINTYNNKPLSSKSKITENLYQVGTQNGESKYQFTTMESAITNAISFANDKEKNTKEIIEITNFVELNDIIRFVLILLFIIFLFRYLKYYLK